MAPAADLERGYPRHDIGYDLRVDTTKSRREPGVRYRPAQASMEEMFAQAVGAGGRWRRAPSAADRPARSRFDRACEVTRSPGATGDPRRRT
ncbi:hypothetical protein [Streptomyces griseoluteus]|uniref:hypothetical protein n=1 Tax=Streptomyces griseoluteus TaxID=29306 RepID=UPI003414CB9A